MNAVLLDIRGYCKIIWTNSISGS